MRIGWIFVLAACNGMNHHVLTQVDGSSSDAPASAQGPWMPVPSPATTDLYSVWAGSASDVVAVGGTPGMTTGNPGVIVRFDGANWAAMQYLVNLLGVFSRTAVGEYGAEGSMTYWNGSGWSTRTVLAAGFLRGTWETSPGTYAVGDAGGLYYTSETGIPGSWGTIPSTTTSALYAVWGATPSDVYAVGADGAILHNPNANVGVTTGWTKTTHGSSTLRAIWGSSPSDMYIVGESPAVILHSTDHGATWTEATLPASAVGLYGITGTSASDIYVVGATGGLAFHSTGNNAWTTEPLPTTKDMYGIAIAASGDVYAVGRGGTIVHKMP
jgi:photosystem II stability/assembly factor-like uncharacterized protein